VDKMLGVFLAASVGTFFGDTLRLLYPNPFILALMAVAIVVVLLVKINSPAPFTLMVAFATFAIIAGGFTAGNNLLGLNIAGVSSMWMPALILVFLIGGGLVAYALWRMFNS
jgi:hypothetical protein